MRLGERGQALTAVAEFARRPRVPLKGYACKPTNVS
jgi:hypothetical protein